MRRKWIGYLLFGIAMLSLVGGLAWLIQLRFTSGEAYPVRSSMRTDPLGAKALYEAYEFLPGIEAERNYTPWNEVDALSPDSTLFYLNTLGFFVHQIADAKAIDTFIQKGGRIIIALNPDYISYQYIDAVDEDEEQSTDEEDSKSDEKESDGYKRSPTSSQEALWAGLSFVYGEHEGGEAALVEGAYTELPERIPWREGGTIVDFKDDIWHPVYTVGEEVVAVERDYGEGTIVVFTDDYLFSNEALLKHRYVGLLAWALGDHKRVIFDETHLGVARRTGIAVLMHRYQLTGMMLAFGCFMVLVIWRGASPLLPPYAGRTQKNVVRVDHSTEAGLGDLVGRSMPLAQMPIEALELWKKSYIRSDADRKYYAKELEEIEALFDANTTKGKTKKPLEIHSKIKSIINRKRRNRQ